MAIGFKARGLGEYIPNLLQGLVCVRSEQVLVLL